MLFKQNLNHVFDLGWKIVFVHCSLFKWACLLLVYALWNTRIRLRGREIILLFTCSMSRLIYYVWVCRYDWMCGSSLAIRITIKCPCWLFMFIMSVFRKLISFRFVNKANANWNGTKYVRMSGELLMLCCESTQQDYSFHWYLIFVTVNVLQECTCLSSFLLLYIYS